jgi:hypothetical protein
MSAQTLNNALMSTSAVDLFELGRQSLHILGEELLAYGVSINPQLELRRGDGLLCHYNLQDGHIYLSQPDPATERGKFVLLLLHALLGFDSTDEVMRLLELITPWLIAHEVGHHLRHRYGLFEPQIDDEERIASQLAIAFVKGHLTLTQRREVLGALAKGIANLSIGLQSFQVSDRMNQAHGLIRHVYKYMNRFYADLLTPEAQTIDAFVQIHLNLRDLSPGANAGQRATPPPAPRTSDGGMARKPA